MIDLRLSFGYFRASHHRALLHCGESIMLNLLTAPVDLDEAAYGARRVNTVLRFHDFAWATRGGGEGCGYA